MGKKWLVVVAAVLVVGILAAYFIGQSRAFDKLGPEDQKASSAPEIKYIPVAEAKGLEVKPEVVIKDWKQSILSVAIKVKNIENRMLTTARLNAYKNQSRWISSSFLVNQLKPGETTTLTGLLEIMNVSSVKSVELSFDPKSIFWEGFTRAKPSAETERPVVPVEPEQPTETERRVYTAADYPKNPKTPGEVTAAFLFYFNKKEYAKAEELLSQRAIESVRAGGGTEVLYGEFFQGRQLKKVELWEMSERSTEADFNFAILRFEDGSSKQIEEVDLIKENGKWKIEMI